MKEDEMGRACNMHGEKKDAYRIFVVKSRRKGSAGKI
jgi:hypothetical protein